VRYWLLPAGAVNRINGFWFSWIVQCKSKLYLTEKPVPSLSRIYGILQFYL
jgi:hypothetical protein